MCVYIYVYHVHHLKSIVRAVKTVSDFCIHTYLHIYLTIRSKYSWKYLLKQVKKLKAHLLLDYNATNVPPYLTHFWKQFS